MRQSRLRLASFVALGSMVAAILPGALFATPLPAESCQNIAGTAIVQGVPTATGLDVYLISATGPLFAVAPGGQVGSLTVDTVDTIDPSGTIHFSGEHWFGMAGIGSFTTSDRAVVSPSGQVNNVSTIVDGATGIYHSHGTLDQTTGVAELKYYGRVCAE